MKFGKEFNTHLEETLPEWRDKFLCYKPLKKLLKQISTADSYKTPDFSLSDIPTSRSWIGLEEWFVRILDEELEKFNDFYVDKEEEFVIRLQELKEKIERVKEKSSEGGISTSESEFSKEMLDIRKDFVTIHGEMVLLKNYSSLNFAGLIKILKKYDKRTGGLLRMPFTQRALHQPFFTTEPLSRLVRECEVNLELLFPSEAEVVEPTPPNQPDLHNGTSTNETPSLQEDTMDIYRSTLAAMRTIQGLRRASSTYNPLSFASFFHNQDDDGTGAVTTENSDSNSEALQNDDTDQDVVHSHK
ncbi:SPX domain-containing protein 4-like [Tasmannia lanceolata]|uniref:SPX domain-containing protein 4-like n=1 Tax=Tasmannia lanceolata TaxID=3420 RepID=UPI004063596D